MSFQISKQDWDKVINYSQYAYDEYGSEIGGYMVVVKDDEGNFLMKDPIILKQVITAGNTVIDKDELAKYLMQTAMKHGTDIYYCWWHSHHTMAAFWSGTDLTAIQQSKHSDVSFSLVVNLKEEYKFRVSIWTPLEIHTDVEVEILGGEKVVPKYIQNKVNKLCSKPESRVIKSTSSNSYTYGGYYYKGRQLTLQDMFDDGDKDAERVNIEAELDNVLLDYIASNDDYEDYAKKVRGLNKQLKKNKSELRVGLVSEDNLDAVIHSIDADMYIHHKGVAFCEDALIANANQIYGLGKVNGWGT